MLARIRSNPEHQFFIPKAKSPKSSKCQKQRLMWTAVKRSLSCPSNQRYIIVIKGHESQVSKLSKDSNSKSPTEMKNGLFQVLTAVKT